MQMYVTPNNNASFHVPDNNQNGLFGIDKKKIVDKIYSENESVRIILSKYGLLNSNEIQQTNSVTIDGDYTYDSNNVVEEIVLFKMAENEYLSSINQPYKENNTPGNNIQREDKVGRVKPAISEVTIIEEETNSEVQQEKVS